MTTRNNTLNVLVAGWFSFEGMGATAGDIIARDIVCNWLKEAGIRYSVAVADSFSRSTDVRWQQCDPWLFSDVIFICGPFGNGRPVTDFLSHFSNVRLTGINLSMLQNLNEWNPFSLLYERDSSRTSNPDITFYAPPSTVPVVGVILVHKQKEYGKRAMHEQANESIERLVNSREMSIVDIDTALEKNKGGLRTPHEVESLIAKMDVVITTRLHGTVLALKNAIPVIPIDPIVGGAKISQQVKTLGWPVLFNIENLDDTLLSDAFNFCLTKPAEAKAVECAAKAVKRIEEIRNDLVRQLGVLTTRVPV